MGGYTINQTNNLTVKEPKPKSNAELKSKSRIVVPSPDGGTLFKSSEKLLKQLAERFDHGSINYNIEPPVDSEIMSKEKKKVLDIDLNIKPREVTNNVQTMPAFVKTDEPPALIQKPIVNRTKADNTVALTEEEKILLELVNRERVKAGLPGYAVDSKLVQLARLKSRDMYQKGYFKHISRDLGSPLDMKRRAGFKARVMGAENIAKAATVQRTHELVMNSDNHRNNVLDPRHTMIGIGVFKTPYGVYITQLFAGN